MESEKEFLLSSPISYAKAGVREETQCLTMVAPSKKLLRKSYRLQQMFTKALIESAETFSSFAGEETEKEEKETEFEGKQVLQLLLSSSVDIEECFHQMDRLALAGAIKVNDKSITDSQWKEVDEEDKEALLAEYVANFIVSLVMKHLSEK